MVIPKNDGWYCGWNFILLDFHSTEPESPWISVPRLVLCPPELSSPWYCPRHAAFPRPPAARLSFQLGARVASWLLADCRFSAYRHLLVMLRFCSLTEFCLGFVSHISALYMYWMLLTHRYYYYLSCHAYDWFSFELRLCVITLCVVKDCRS